MNKNPLIKLKVAKAHEEYIGKNIVTLDIVVKQKLNIISGDIIEIKGGNITAAQVWPEKNNLDSENLIRMDQYVRKNAGVSLGDFVTIKKIDPDPAHEIVLAPMKDLNLISENQDLIIKKSFLGRSFVKGNILTINFFGTGYLYNVVSTKPQGVVILSEETKLIVYKKPISKLKEKQVIGYEDVGGLKKQIESIREMVELPFKYPAFFEKLNVSAPKGILLYGPPGTGKTLLAKALSNELKSNFVAIDAPQIMAKFVGEAEERLRTIFNKAKESAPTVIFIDEIDAIAAKRDGLSTDVEKRVVAQLLALMDGVNTREGVIVIGATNRLDYLDPALRRPGRFDREINISIPDEEGRLNILKIHTRNVPLNKNVNLKNIAKRTHGFVGADLAALVKEAAIYSIKESLKKTDLDKKEILIKNIEKLNISKQAFEYALDVVQASALREIFVDVPNIDYTDVGALKEYKSNMKDLINLSLYKRDVLEKMNIKPLRKILLYGPPGTGKTMFVKATAKQFGVNFIYVKGPEVFNKWVGESEKAIRRIFKKAKDVSPSILFFDEIDSLTQSKGTYQNNTNVLDQLLTELDNIGDKDVIFVTATNRPDLIDKSFLRSGRIDKIMEFKMPDKKERKEILELLLKKIPHNKINIHELVEQTIDFTGADLNLLVTEASFLALKENKYSETNVKEEHILKIIKKMKKAVKVENNEIYSSFKSNKQVARYIT